MDSRVYNGLTPRRTGAFPEGSPLLWNGIAELSNAYIEVPIDLRETFRPESGETFLQSRALACDSGRNAHETVSGVSRVRAVPDLGQLNRPRNRNMRPA